MKSVGFTSSQQVLDIVTGVIWVEALFEDKVASLFSEIDSLLASTSVRGL